MKKKILSIVLALILVVSLFSLVACNNGEVVKKGTTGSNESQQNGGGSSLTIGGNSSNNNGSTAFEVSTEHTFKVKSEKDFSADLIRLNKSVVIKSYDGKEITTYSVITKSSKEFEITAPVNGYDLDGWYTIKLNAPLSFVNYQGINEIQFHVTEKAFDGKYSYDVIPVNYNSIKGEIVEDELNKGFYDLHFNSALTNYVPTKNDVLLITKEDGTKAAYKVVTASESSIAGVTDCYVVIPNSDEIYDRIQIKETQKLNQDSNINLVTADDLAGALAQIEEIAAAEIGFEVGSAKFKINVDLKGDVLYLAIAMTIPNIIKVEGQAEMLDLTLEFGVESKITVDTEISLGKLIDAAKNGVVVNADITNRMKFKAELSETGGGTIVNDLDDVLNKIASFINNDKMNDVEINIFNWIIPIGNGVASINFDTKLVMDFAFSGSLGVECTSELSFGTMVELNPKAEGNKLTYSHTEPEFSFTGLTVKANAEVHTKVGLKAKITFNLLANVLSLGIAAEVGNYNDLYGKIETTNLLAENVDVGYGYYFETGLYYDVNAVFAIASLLNKEPSLIGGRQFIEFTHKGSDYMLVGDFASSDYVVSSKGLELDINANIVKLNPKVADRTTIPGSALSIKANDKVDLVCENGVAKLVLKNPGEALTKYEIELSAYGRTTKSTVSTIASGDIVLSEVVTMALVNIETGLSQNSVKAKYLNGADININYVPSAGQVQIAKGDLHVGDIIVIMVDGVEIKYVYVV